MAQQGPGGSASAPPPSDLPPSYSEVVGNPQYGFVVPGADNVPTSGYPHPKTYTAPGVYPHPPAPPGAYHQAPYSQALPQTSGPVAAGGPVTVGSVPVGIVIPPAMGSEPTTIQCFNCNKTVTTRVTYSTAWHTHLVAGSICVTTMVCSMCCLGLIPYCFDSFKDAEHYCPNCNSFIGKNNKC